MTNCDIGPYLDALILREGDYVNHPADRGGATRWGITEAVARQNGYDGAMRHLPRSKAEAIYRAIYWTKPAFDQVATLAPRLAIELLDSGVNMGPAVASGFLQRALNALNRNGRDFSDLVVDRQIGPRTLGALDAFLRARSTQGEEVLRKAVDALQGAHYIQLAEARPSQEAFAYGWIANRIG